MSIQQDNATLSGQRFLYFDCLRILGAFAVILIHVASYKWFTADISTTEWNVLNFYNCSLVRWAVPVFIMISGALFLDGKQSITHIYKKNILRIVTAFLFWSPLYAVVTSLTGGGGKVPHRPNNTGTLPSLVFTDDSGPIYDDPTSAKNHRVIGDGNIFSPASDPFYVSSPPFRCLAVYF